MIAAASQDGFFMHEVLEVLILAVFHVVSLFLLMAKNDCTGSRKVHLRKCK